MKDNCFTEFCCDNHFHHFLTNASFLLNPIDIVFPASKVEFEGKKYKAFNNPKWYLEHLYGDYMKLPDEKDRKNHNPKVLLFNEGKNLNSKEEFKKINN